MKIDKTKTIPIIASAVMAVIVIISICFLGYAINKHNKTAQTGNPVEVTSQTPQTPQGEDTASEAMQGVDESSEGETISSDETNSSSNSSKAEDNGDVSSAKAEDKTPVTKPEVPDNVKVSGKRRNVAYYTSWSAYARNVMVSDIDASLLTHLNFAFGNLNADGEVIVGDSWVDVEKPMGGESWDSPSNSRGHFAQLKALKKKYPHLKTLISVGGWTWSNNFSDVAADANKRKKFATSAVAFCDTYGFDGVDIDWEYPVEGGNNITHRKEDKENFTKLLAEIRAQMNEASKKNGKTYLLTIAGGGNATFTKNTELKKMMEYLDFINVMTYDYHGAWDTTTNHNTPLFANKKDTSKEHEFSVDWTINAYLDAGVKPEDMNLGLAFYGRGWTGVSSTQNNGLWQEGKKPGGVGFGSGTWEGGCFDYDDIVQNYLNKAGYKRYFDDVAKMPYLFNGTSFISYDDEESIGYKLKYAESKKLGGTMFWEFSADKNKTLQKVITKFYGDNLAK